MPKTTLLKQRNKMTNVKNPKRVEIIDNEIAIFAPSAHQVIIDQVIYYSNDQALSHYEPHDQSLRFPKTAKNAETIWKILSADFTADFDLSSEFLVLINTQETQAENATTAAEPRKLNMSDGAQQLTKRVDILIDAHPDEMVAIYAPYNHTPTLHGILKLKAHYVSDDRSWRCSISVIDSVREAFPSPEYHHSEEFLRQFEPIDCGF